MAVPTPTDLAALFPEFSGVVSTHLTMVQAHIDAVAPSFSETVWGATYPMAVCLGVAHSLTLSPYGTHARLDPSSEETVYSIKLKQLRKRLGTTRFLLTDV
jgi:hypothetical protein